MTCGLVLALAPSAFADSVNLTRFSKTVSGVAPTTATSVTVNLLRNTTDASSNVVRQQVDTFTATPDATHKWSGSFVTHAFSNGSDQVEVSYTPASTLPNPTQVTIGGGNFLASSMSATANQIFLPANNIDGSFGIADNGSSLTCNSSCQPFTATVDGTAAPAPVANKITFTTPVTNANAVLITETIPATPPFPTTVTLTDTAPLLTPDAIGGPPAPFEQARSEASCSAFLVTNEVVCGNLTPGSYALTQVRGGSAVSTQTVTVPAQAAKNTSIPSLGSASFAGLQGGDQLKLASGAHVLTTLTVRPFTISSATPFGDVLNGTPNATVTGVCSPGEFFNDNSQQLCSAAGGIPAPNDFGSSSSQISLFTFGGVTPIDRTLAQLDDTSDGETQIDMPAIAFRTPGDGEAIHTPFAVFALGRYNDPAAMAAAVNAAAPSIAGVPPFTSSVSTAPVLFQYAPQGSTNYTTLGNINVAGGLPLPTLAPGLYVDRFTTVDARGDARYFESNFVYQGNATGPPGVSPTGPPAPSCTASTTRGKVTVNSVRATADKKKGKKSKNARVTINCTSSTAGARVAVWLQRGSSVVADGSGVVKNGKVKIVLTGTVKKGTYQLIETIDSGGLATEATHSLTLK
ncbi:MAG: hypothetical protein M3071_14370 [Actinomycetota bacterium]|nr:hypothetical protein [Actinomycetota bacterium]